MAHRLKVRWSFAIRVLCTQWARRLWERLTKRVRASKKDALHVRVPRGIVGTDELFFFFYHRFQFPYFGWNWNALNDCMCDLSWIPEKDIFLIHQDIPTLDAQNAALYQDVLLYWVGDWKRYPDQHRFSFAFPAAEACGIEGGRDEI